MALSLGLPRPGVTRHRRLMESGLSSDPKARGRPAIRARLSYARLWRASTLCSNGARRGAAPPLGPAAQRGGSPPSKSPSLVLNNPGMKGQADGAAPGQRRSVPGVPVAHPRHIAGQRVDLEVHGIADGDLAPGRHLLRMRDQVDAEVTAITSFTVSEVPFSATDPLRATNRARSSGARKVTRVLSPSRRNAITSATPSTCPDTICPPSSSPTLQRALQVQPLARRPARRPMAVLATRFGRDVHLEPALGGTAQRDHGQADPVAGDRGADVDARHVIAGGDPRAQVAALLQRRMRPISVMMPVNMRVLACPGDPRLRSWFGPSSGFILGAISGILFPKGEHPKGSRQAHHDPRDRRQPPFSVPAGSARPVFP